MRSHVFSCVLLPLLFPGLNCGWWSPCTPRRWRKRRVVRTADDDDTDDVVDDVVDVNVCWIRQFDHVLLCVFIVMF